MASYRISQAAELLGVSADTVRRLVDAGRLQASRSPGGQRLIDGAGLAVLAASLGRAEGEGPIAAQSARNRLPGIVTRVTKDGVMAQVEMQVGPHRIVSLMTREAADELELAPGVLAVAAVKATNVVVERPA
jgi:molybdopterin-binding protein